MIHVAVGLLEDPRGQILIAQRRAGTHMAGRWEFPGGKIHDGEPVFDALQRELHEELGIVVHGATPLIVIEHEYQDRHVRLDTWCVTQWVGQPRGREGQQLRWIAAEQLKTVGLLEADTPIVDALLAQRAVVQ